MAEAEVVTEVTEEVTEVTEEAIEVTEEEAVREAREEADSPLRKMTSQLSKVSHL